MNTGSSIRAAASSSSIGVWNPVTEKEEENEEKGQGEAGRRD